MTLEVHPGVKHLKGGAKQFWLRTNRPEVENFYSAYGPDATMKRYNMRPDTLRRFFERQDRDIKLNRLTEADRWVMRICNEGIRECRRRLRDLEEWKEDIEPVIQIGKGIITVLGNQRVQSRVYLKKKVTPTLPYLEAKSEK